MTARTHFCNLCGEPPETLSLLQNRWHYLTVDEYQDTSGVQYEMMRLLCGENICVVGDLDQCIYTWRQAEIKTCFHLNANSQGNGRPA